MERFDRRNSIAVIISTVSMKRPEKRSGSVPEYPGMRNSSVFNSYRTFSQNRSKSVPSVRGTLKLLITIVLQEQDTRFLPKSKKI